MTPLVPITMFGCVPLVLVLFRKLRAEHAVIAGLAVAWMFLPQYAYDIPILPTYNKVNATSYAVLIGILAYHRNVFRRLRFHPVDLPMLLWCASSFCSSVSNGLGAWDGFSAMLGKVTMWGLPYLIGRLYFDNLPALRDLGIGMFLAALVNVPFCLYEVAMSPRLHRIVYGWHPHHFGQTKRGGGWRPQVFMEHGLMNAMWMASGTLTGIRLLAHRVFGKRLPLFPLPPWAAVALVTLTFFLCKSMGATLLMLMGLGAIWATNLLRMRLPLLVIMFYPAVYMALRGSGTWDGNNLIRLIEKHTSEERSGSLGFRIANENILSDKARRQPLFGWAGWKRAWVYNDAGETVSVPDGLWIIAFGQNGVFGLTALVLVALLPQWLFLKRYPIALWRRPDIGAVAPLSVLLGLYMVDNVLNNMYNPLMMVCAGGLSGLSLRPPDGMPTAGSELPADTPPAPATPRLL